MTNEFGWPLPKTDQMMEVESPYAPPAEPAANLARRLTMLAHLCFDSTVWGGHTGRLERYWPAMAERIEGSAYTPSLSVWWDGLIRDLPGRPLRNTMLLHEKNLMVMPTRLPNTQVADEAVLAVLRENAAHLTDLARVWAKVRRDLRAPAIEDREDDES